MDAQTFKNLMKQQAKLYRVEGFELESAAGALLTETVKTNALATNDDTEITRRFLFILATVMKCFGISAEMLANPAIINILNKMDKMLDGNSPTEGENLQ